MTTPTTPAPTTPAPAPAAPAPGTPEYDAAMAARAAAEAAPKPSAETLILGKFKSPEDLAKAYTELEAKLGGKKEEPAKPAEGEKKPSDADTLKIAQEAQDIVTKAGLKQDDLAAAFAKDGKLTDDQYNALANVGVPKAMVDSYLSGIAAQADQFSSKVYEMAGGTEKFNAILGWAKTNAPADQVKAYNDAIDSGDLGRISLAVSAFKAAYANSNPALLGGAPGSSTVGYRSQAEITAAMRDPRYAKDEAYRADVYAKIKAMS